MSRHYRELTQQFVFKARMEAQCEQIQYYMLMVWRKEGRRLSQNEAALEWIERYAEAFAGDGGTSVTTSVTTSPGN